MADSSTAQDLEVKDGEQGQAQEGQIEDTKAAESSNADDAAKAVEGVKPESMLEAVKQAIEPAKADDKQKTEGEEKSPDSEGGEQEGATDKSATESKDKDADERLPFHKHPRWQEVQQERKALKEKLERLEPVVQNFQGFQRSVAEAGLSATEVDEGFEIMKLMKSDPAQAYERLKAYMEPLAAFVGQVLPGDLQERVEAGTLDEESARELARARNQKTFAESQVAKTAEQREIEEQERELQALRSHLDNCAAAVTKWETEWKSSDPDYAVKQPLVDAQLLKLNQQRGMPKTIDEAVERVNEARKVVEKTLEPALKKTREKRVVTGGSSAAQAAPQPKTLKEAIALAARAK